MIVDIQKYLQESFGLPVDVKAVTVEQLNELPLYLKHAYRYSLLGLEGHWVILVESDNVISKTALQLKKQSIGIREYFRKPVVFVIKNQSAQQRRKMIQEKVNFIVPYNQIYLPELLISLKENVRKPQSFPGLLTPSAQLLLLYHLQVERLDEFTFKEIAGKLGYSPKTITKIAEELKAKNLCRIEGTKEKYFSFEVQGKELWKKVEPHMQTPIFKSYYTDKKDDPDFCLSGDSALSHYTFLSETGRADYAIYKAEFEELKRKGHWEYLDESEGNVRIEVWKYNPRLLSANGYIDPLSLYLCYKDDVNERVEAEIKELTDKKIW